MPKSCLKKVKDFATYGSSSACSIIPIALNQSNIDSGKVDFLYLESLKLDFLRINELQRNHAVYLSLHDLRSTKKLLQVGASLLDPVVHAYLAGDTKSWTVTLSRAKRACTLLAGACECRELEFWCVVVSIVTSPLLWQHDDGLCVDFLGDVGVLSGLCSPTSICYRSILSIAFSLCLKASGYAKVGPKVFNDNICRAVSLLHDYCLASCPKNLLNQSQSLSTLTETVFHILVRGDEGVGEKLEEFRNMLRIKSWSSPEQLKTLQNEARAKRELQSHSRGPALHPTWYVGDGLLLPPPLFFCSPPFVFPPCFKANESR
mmetsp:Transcript_8409/g.13308  ORF Transcript_8409/g.13308 Transcript_8409/m.13308 type:complete len:318 (+) Transcript_8409:1396-2349(+)